MKILTSQNINKNPNNPQTFHGFWNNKKVLKGLEYVADHSATFIAGTELVGSMAIRPIAIGFTPKTEKENKNYAVSKSIASGLLNFAIVKTLATPIENSLKKIEKNPDKYLNEETIKNLKNGTENFEKSNNYKLMAQLLKLGVNVIASIPKTILTVSLMSFLVKNVFSMTNKEKESPKNQTPTFGNHILDKFTEFIGNIINKKPLQNFSKKFSNTNFETNLIYAKDSILTAIFAGQTIKDKNIDKNRKAPIINNSIISTILSITSSFAISKIFESKTEKFIEKFKTLNAKDPNLHKYVEGLKLAQTALIMATIYYGIIPIISTFSGEKLATKSTKKAAEA